MIKNHSATVLSLILWMGFLYWAHGQFRLWVADGYIDKIPPELKIEKVKLVDGDLGGLGWCGVTIFELKNDILEDVKNDGLQALTDARQSREVSIRGKYKQYTSWRETPYIETGDGMTLEDRWLGGMSCAKSMQRDLKNSLSKAIHSPKSYYAKSNDAGLVVIPHLGVAAYIHFD